jgi:hypothetical protein
MHPLLTPSRLAHWRRLVLPPGYVALPSTSDGGAAPSPHHLGLHIYRRVGKEDVLQVRAVCVPVVGCVLRAAGGGRGCCHGPAWWQRRGRFTVASRRACDGPGPLSAAPTRACCCGCCAAPQNIVRQASKAPESAAAAADAVAPAAPAPAATPGGAATANGGASKSAHNTPLLVLYGSNMGACWLLL